MCVAAVTPDQVIAWREQIRAALFANGSAPELAPESHGLFEPAAGVVAERVSYGTQFGLRVPAIVIARRTPPRKVLASLL